MQTDVHALSGIRTHDPSVRVSEDSSCLRPCGHCGRLARGLLYLLYRNIMLLRREDLKCKQHLYVSMGFEVITAPSFFLNVIPCSLVDTYLQALRRNVLPLFSGH
jgi:hypothetical protein